MNELKDESEAAESESSGGTSAQTSSDEVFHLPPRDLLMAQSGYPLCYLGSLPVGKVGDTSFLDWAIRKVMNDPAKVEHHVSLHLLELGIKLYCRASAELVLKYPYPKVNKNLKSKTNSARLYTF